MRVGAGEAGGLEVAASVAITLVAVGPIGWAAGRLYAGSVLRFGGRVSLGRSLARVRAHTND